MTQIGNDNAPKAGRGKRGEKPPSGKRRAPKVYSPEIKTLTQKIKKIQGRELEARVEIGLQLLQAKELLPHGGFRPWLRQEFSWSERTATTYMNLAQHYEGKTAKFADLDLGTALALVTDPTLEKVRDEVFERARLDGKITREDVRKQIAEVKSVQPKRPTKSKASAPGQAKQVDYETPSAGVTSASEISAETIKEPAAEVAEALQNLLSMVEKNRLHCEPDDVAMFFLEDDCKRISPANSECFGFVTGVTEALLRMPEPQLKLAS